MAGDLVRFTGNRMEGSFPLITTLETFLLLESPSLVTLLPFEEVECENFIFSQKHLWNSLPQNGSSSAEGASGGSQCGWLGLLHSVHYNLHILSSMNPLRCKVHLPCTVLPSIHFLEV